ncbi:MAG: hypothetical protein ACP5T5_05100 [Thermoprotei archaeon]
MKGAYVLVVATLITLGFALAVYQNFQTSAVTTVTSVNALIVSKGMSAFQVEASPVIPTPFSVKAQGFFAVRLTFNNTGNRTVYVDNIAADTPGFTISSSYFSESLPLSVPPGTSRVLYVAVQVGPSQYAGSVNLTVAVSYS